MEKIEPILEKVVQDFVLPYQKIQILKTYESFKKEHKISKNGFEDLQSHYAKLKKMNISMLMDELYAIYFQWMPSLSKKINDACVKEKISAEYLNSLDSYTLSFNCVKKIISILLPEQLNAFLLTEKLLEFCKKGDYQAAQAILKENIDVNFVVVTHPKYAWESPLSLAVESKSIELIDLLLDNKADINIQYKAINIQSHTPLNKAASTGNLTIVDHLLNKGADKTCTQDDGNVLYIAIKNGHFEIVKYLIEKHSMDINKKNKRDITPLMQCVSRAYDIALPVTEEKRIEMLQYLIDKGADTKLKRAYLGYTALNIAEENGFLNAKKVLEKYS